MKKEIRKIQEELVVESDKYLTFSIGDEVYALEISYVDDIIGIQDITTVPEQPEHLMGVINLRGIIIPVIDIRLRFKKEKRAYDDRTCIIVVKIDEAAIGIVVDTVLEVINISEDDIAEPPNVADEENKQYMSGIGKFNGSVVIIIDCDELVRDE
jgi:purine-binding chemotaxis protein CheW